MLLAVRQPGQLSSSQGARAPLDRQPATPYQLCWCLTWRPPWPPCQWQLCRLPGGPAAGGRATMKCGRRVRSRAVSQCSGCRLRPCHANVSSQGCCAALLHAGWCSGMPCALRCGADACAGRRLCCPALKLVWLPLLAHSVQPQLPHALPASEAATHPAQLPACLSAGSRPPMYTIEVTAPATEEDAAVPYPGSPSAAAAAAHDAGRANPAPLTAEQHAEAEHRGPPPA